MKKSLDKLNNKFKVAEEKVTVLEDKSVEIIQSEQQRKNIWRGVERAESFSSVGEYQKV